MIQSDGKIKIDMGTKSDKIRPSPTVTSTKRGVKSVNLNMGEHDSNIGEFLRSRPHDKIIEWLENRNLGKASNTINY